LQQLVLAHFTHTNSSVAKFVLDDFENQLKNFVKVFPKDYKKVMQSAALKLASVESK
jgi:glutamate synthase (NADPH) large chain